MSDPVARLNAALEGRYAIDQEQFVIGRGSKYSDLPIKDVSRPWKSRILKLGRMRA